MEITSRQTAIAQRLTRYFTGQPCKSGHIAERYTKCSVCVECLHPRFEVSDGRLQTVRLKIVLHSDDVEFFIATAHALGMARQPRMRREDVLTRLVPRPRGGSTHLHAFKCFPEDAQALYHLQETLSFARLSPEQQEAVRDAAGRRLDGWVPPAPAQIQSLTAN